MPELTVHSSLEKIFFRGSRGSPYEAARALRGEEFSLQLAIHKADHGGVPGSLSVESPLEKEISLFLVDSVPCELPAYPNHCDEDYLSTQPGLFPDVLYPLGASFEIKPYGNTVVWVCVRIPQDFPAGEVPLRFVLKAGQEELTAEFTLRVVGASLPPQELIFTQWVHGDSIADWYDVPVYSEEYWALLERYLSMAGAHGMNMALTPVFTPALDTEPGRERRCTQLVEIEPTGEGYRFSYDRVTRFVELAQRCGISHFEISHLFSQWGAGYAPNIYAKDGRRLFGWETKAVSPEYRGFLRQFLPDFTAYLRKQGLEDRVMFHISDEPEGKHLESYSRARQGAAPYLEGFPIRDALSDVRFYEAGLIDRPIPAIDHIEPFLQARVPDLWAYCCCGQNVDVGNRFLAMPSYRNRILGQQLWKYEIAGFLHWGYNFWYSQNAREMINPFAVTDSRCAFPGGDPFSVYPGESGPIASLRLKVFHEALQDIRAFRMLEKMAGRQAVEDCMEGYEELTFRHYPRNSQSLLETREKVNQKIEDLLKIKG